jgi:RNA polymerase sigma-70 factor (ECF subfamily)
MAEDAWKRFVDLYTPLIFFWARKLGLQEPDAADLVQEVLALLVQKMPAFVYERQGSFRGWLRIVLRNKWRERQRGRNRASPPGGAAALEDVADSDEGLDVTEAEFQRELTRRALELMQSEFQPNTWKACWEHVAEGRQAADIARELGITVNAVYLATSRVLRRLRQEFAGILD